MCVYIYIFFPLIYLHPASLHVSVVDYSSIYSSEHKKQGSANADSSLTTPNQGRCSALAQEVDSLVRPSHRSININWIDH